jgi:hypothetical protein
VPLDPHRALTPSTAGAWQWDAIALPHRDLAEYAAAHWLGAWHRLPALPAGFASTRCAMHLLAFYVVSPARRAVNGRSGLRWTAGGFGTPYFGDDVQVRVEGTNLVVQTRAEIRHVAITTLWHAGDLVGRQPDPADKAGFDVPDLPDLDARLFLDDEAVAFLDAWFGFSTSVLEQLRVDAAPFDPSRVQLWPEHFDMALEAGNGAGGRRATFGCSPGDEHHPEPYAYVSAWQPVDRAEPFWNDDAFEGASLSLTALAGAPDQRAAALDFLRRGLALLTAAAP